MKIFLVVILVWLLCGFISTVIYYVPIIRGNEFRSCNFNDFYEMCLFFFLFGVFGLIIMLNLVYDRFIRKREFCLLQKLVYKIANIGVKKNNREDSDD